MPAKMVTAGGLEPIWWPRFRRQWLFPSLLGRLTAGTPLKIVLRLSLALETRFCISFSNFGKDERWLDTAQ